MNVGGKLCTDPAGHDPPSRGPSARTYADWSRGVTIRLSSDVRPWPALCCPSWRVRPWLDGVRLGLAWASHPVGWHVGKKKAGHHRWHPALWLSEGVQEALDLLQCLLVYHSPSLALAKELFCPLII